MLLLIVGLLVFFAPHLFTIARERRTAVIAKVGEGAYKGLYSLVSAIGLVLIVLGWGQAAFVPVWNPPAGFRHLALPLVLLAFILLAAAYIPGKIQAWTKHPMLAAVKIWALAHLLANGDLAGMLLFGSFLAFGVIDRIAVKRRERIEGAPARGGPVRNDVFAVAAGTVAFLVFALYLHPQVIGRSVIPM